MVSKTFFSLIFIVLTTLTMAGCASGPPENRADLGAIGKEVCRERGGLSGVDSAGYVAIYSCKDGMNYQLGQGPFIGKQ